MRVIGDGRVVTSASDLSQAARCEYALLRRLDEKRGIGEPVPASADPMLKDTIDLGHGHEKAVLRRYRETLGRVVEIPETGGDPARLAAALVQTRTAFAEGADLVYQAAFSDERFVGFADFILRMPDGRYQVQDTKLARHAKVTALLQLAAYAQRLRAIGVEPHDTVLLILGDGTRSEHALRDIEPVARVQEARLHALVDARMADPRPVAWGDPGVAVCGRCEVCLPQVQAHRDLLMVAGMRLSQRAALIEAGIGAIDALAALPEGAAVPGIGAGVLAGLRAQARVQLRAEPGAPPPVEVADAAALGVIPPPDAGDVFFDFEGDPLFSEGDGLGERTRWGLDYLFGLVEAPGGESPGAFRAFWAHDLDEEREAFLAFLGYLRERLHAHPGMHVYHYAAYERAHLLSLAARHGVGEDEVDDLLRRGVLVDLYPVVKRALRVGAPSYSLKVVEKAYLTRGGEVATAGDSVVEYREYRRLREQGDLAEAGERLQAIADYNEVDCRSTLGLRDWLLGLAAEHGVAPGSIAATGLDREPEPHNPLREALLAHAGRTGDPARTDDELAFGLAAAAIDYHRREHKRFWQEHFARLTADPAQWEDGRDVLRVDSVEVLEDWAEPSGRQRLPRRSLRLTGEWGPGSSPRPSGMSRPFALYGFPGPFTREGRAAGSRPDHEITVTAVEDGGAGAGGTAASSVEIIETSSPGPEGWPEFPTHLTPSGPPPVGSLRAAIEAWGRAVAGTAPEWPRDPASDLLRRIPPRTRSGAALAPVGAGEAGVVDALVASILDLDDSYVAVQGPPGTGKTWTGARVIARLVERGWRIGVVGQSHRTVENLLAEVVAAGVPRELVGKKPVTGEQPTGEEPWTPLGDRAVAAFASAEGGRVLGGTAWDFANPERVAPGSLDLLVIDEAGQFSLAMTIASARAARRLLLLGDPQQLPQVSQAVHPEPVDASALGHLGGGADVLPAELGYFLAHTRRMAPPLAARVSRLSYAGRLDSLAPERELAGIAPGLHPVAVEHEGRSVDSPEEADEVVRIARDVLGCRWRTPEREEPLGEEGVIVVAAYNAQVARIRDRLDAAGLTRVPVGTVDRFQGREAAVAIVSLAASSAAEVPRGMEFLIMRNRLNVAISRARWAAYLVHSPGLLEHLPATPRGLAELSAFLELVG